MDDACLRRSPLSLSLSLFSSRLLQSLSLAFLSVESLTRRLGASGGGGEGVHCTRRASERRYSASRLGPENIVSTSLKSIDSRWPSNPYRVSTYIVSCPIPVEPSEQESL